MKPQLHCDGFVVSTKPSGVVGSRKSGCETGHVGKCSTFTGVNGSGPFCSIVIEPSLQWRMNVRAVKLYDAHGSSAVLRFGAGTAAASMSHNCAVCMWVRAMAIFRPNVPGLMPSGVGVRSISVTRSSTALAKLAISAFTTRPTQICVIGFAPLQVWTNRKRRRRGDAPPLTRAENRPDNRPVISGLLLCSSSTPQR